MTGILVLWPDSPSRPIDRYVADSSLASVFQPVDVLIAGGEEDTVASDVRFDHQDDVRSELGLGVEGSAHSLLLAAWRKWGIDTPNHLSGDFAFAVWIAAEHRLYLVRDHVGARPLYLARFEHGFAAASDQASLLALPGVDRRISERALAMALVDFWHLPEQTMFEGIQRLQGGHLAELSRPDSPAQMHNYWSLPRSDLELRNDAEYVEAFHEAFADAVRTRIEPTKRIGVEFSGGIDSSAVAGALARSITPVQLFSGSFAADQWDGGRFDELRYRRWAKEDVRFISHEIPAADSLTESLLERSLDVHRAPLAGSMTLVRLMLYDAAASEGMELMFDGVDGDATVIPATDRLLQLARTFHLAELGSDLLGTISSHGRAGASFALHSLFAPLRDRISMARRRLPSYIADSPVRADVLRRTGILDAIASAAGPIGDVRSAHISSIRDGLLAAGLESTAALGASVGLQVRHPFADRRLIELAIAMPAKQLYRKGETRYIERVALTGFAPRDVMFRGSKGGLPPAYARKYLRLLNIDEVVRDGGSLVGDLVDPDKLARTWESWRTDSGIAHGWALLPLAVTARWIAGVDERQAGHGLAS